jgi:hypothetical protein
MTNLKKLANAFAAKVGVNQKDYFTGNDSNYYKEYYALSGFADDNDKRYFAVYFSEANDGKRVFEVAKTTDDVEIINEVIRKLMNEFGFKNEKLLTFEKEIIINEKYV